MTKKILLFSSFLATISMFSQECNIEVKNDDLTRSTNISTPFVKFDDFSLCFIGGKTAGEYHKMFIFTNEKQCLEESNQIYFLFEGDEQFNRNNQTSFNCDGFGRMIINSAKIRNLLKEKKLLQMQITTMSNILRVELTDEQSELIKKYYNCLEDRKSYKDKIKYKY